MLLEVIWIFKTIDIRYVDLDVENGPNVDIVKDEAYN